MDVQKAVTAYRESKDTRIRNYKRSQEIAYRRFVASQELAALRYEDVMVAKHSKGDNDDRGNTRTGQRVHGTFRRS